MKPWYLLAPASLLIAVIVCDALPQRSDQVSDVTLTKIIGGGLIPLPDDPEDCEDDEEGNLVCHNRKCRDDLNPASNCTIARNAPTQGCPTIWCADPPTVDPSGGQQRVEPCAVSGHPCQNNDAQMFCQLLAPGDPASSCKKTNLGYACGTVDAARCTFTCAKVVGVCGNGPAPATPTNYRCISGGCTLTSGTESCGAIDKCETIVH